MVTILSIALRNMIQAKRRTLLLVSALALVTLVLIIGLALSQALSETMIRSATVLASGHVNVAGFHKNKPTDAWPMISGIGEIRRIAEENTPELDHVVVRGRAWAKIVSARHSMFVSPSGIDIDKEPRLPEVMQLAKQSDYKEGGSDQVLGSLERLKKPRTVLLFAAQAKRLEVEIGDPLTITASTGSGRTNAIDVTVAAIAKDFGYMSNWNVFINQQNVHELYQTVEDTSSVVMIYLKNPAKSEAVMSHLRTVYEKHGYQLMEHRPDPFFFKFDMVAGEDWTGQKLDLTVWSDEISYLSWVTAALDSVSLSLVGIMMVIIAVGIMNAMWISVRERTREIGMMRAVGMTRFRVLSMFLSEALLIGLLATSLGAVLGAIVAVVLNGAGIEIGNEAVKAVLMSDVLQLSVRPMQVVTVILIFTFLTGLAALGPALRASKLQPIMAIGHAD
ncbi:MAG: FtsX-like permease family protein [Myxococcota bacterium]|nr:FtsX-like permease family protein [Myxococcota bacterium]